MQNVPINILINRTNFIFSLQLGCIFYGYLTQFQLSAPLIPELGMLLTLFILYCHISSIPNFSIYTTFLRLFQLTGAEALNFYMIVYEDGCSQPVDTYSKVTNVTRSHLSLLLSLVLPTFQGTSQCIIYVGVHHCSLLVLKMVFAYLCLFPCSSFYML